MRTVKRVSLTWSCCLSGHNLIGCKRQDCSLSLLFRIFWILVILRFFLLLKYTPSILGGLSSIKRIIYQKKKKNACLILFKQCISLLILRRSYLRNPVISIMSTLRYTCPTRLALLFDKTLACYLYGLFAFMILEDVQHITCWLTHCVEWVQRNFLSCGFFFF